MEFKYIMVTNWDLHWNNLQKKWGNSTLFTMPMIKDGISDGIRNSHYQEATTLFIKLTKDNRFEKSWIGKSKNFRRDNYKEQEAIRFDVADLHEVECPPAFKSYKCGWHLNKEVATIPFNEAEYKKASNLQPPFFDEMESCSWESFESYCCYLLKLIGIHDIHPFPRRSQQGKADGFFRFHTLTVLYDATLGPDYLTVKDQQIENYVNQLRRDKISINSHSYTIKDSQRQVWIITRGQQVRNLGSEDWIKVKEVPHKRLIDVYNKRLEEEISTDELWDVLKDLS